MTATAQVLAAVEVASVCAVFINARIGCRKSAVACLLLAVILFFAAVIP